MSGVESLFFFWNGQIWLVIVCWNGSSSLSFGWLIDHFHFSILFALHLSWFLEGTERRGCSWGCSESSASRFAGRKLCKNSTSIYSISNNGGNSTKTRRSTSSTKTGTSASSTKTGTSSSSTENGTSSTCSTKTGTSSTGSTSNTGNKPSINIISRTTSYTTSVCTIASISTTHTATPQPSCCCSSCSCSCRWRCPMGGKGRVWVFCNLSVLMFKRNAQEIGQTTLCRTWMGSFFKFSKKDVETSQVLYY